LRQDRYSVDKEDVMRERKDLIANCFNGKRLVGAIAVVLVSLAMAFNHDLKAQNGQRGGLPRAPDPRQLQIINASSIVTDPQSGLNRVACSRGADFPHSGLTMRFSIGFPEVEVLGRPGRVQGSWTIRNIIFTMPEQVAAYALDGTFNLLGNSRLNDGTFTLVGTANYQYACRQGSPPPATPGTPSPNPGTVNVTIQGTCGTRNAAGVIRPTDLTVEASDPAGMILSGSFRAIVACTTGNNFSTINNNLGQH
jgi:hypothetical protein